jgi:ferrous iron transport protein B
MKVALVGNPNAGKSSIFNRLTGLSQKVGNFSGVTVDKRTGAAQLPNGQEASVTDLPGTYSLYPTSLDEKIAVEVLANPQHPNHPEVVIYVADASNLERHLLLCTQVADLGLPVVVALNMVDVAQAAGIYCHADRLAKALGLPVVVVNGRTGAGVDQLRAALPQAKPRPELFYRLPPEWANLAKKMQGLSPTLGEFQAVLQIHHPWLPLVGTSGQVEVKEWVKQAGLRPIRGQVDETMSRYAFLGPVVGQAVDHAPRAGGSGWSERLDQVLMHKVWGSLFFFGLLLLLFQAIFAWSQGPMEAIEAGFAQVANWLKGTLPPGWFTDLLTDGMLAGLAGVVVFVPQIAILSFFISLLEESGYMARAVFLSDSIMRKFGLNGRSIVSLISGMACAIPAIMSTRGIRDWRERLVTVLVTPLMSCSARIPVFMLLVTFVVPNDRYWLIFNAQGLVFMGLYLTGAGSAIVSAWALGRLLKVQGQGFFLLELPSYKMPHWKNVGLTVYEKARTFVLEAGKMILVIAVVLWALAAYGPADRVDAAVRQAQAEAQAASLDTTATADLVAAKKLEASYAGMLGRAIEPAIAPLGFDWKIGIALITSFAAREVFVGTMATLYSVGSAGDSDLTTVGQKMRSAKNAAGEPMYTPAVAAALLLYYLFAMQCMSTVAVVYRETNSWKWPVVQVIYLTSLAYLAALAARFALA